MGRRLLIAGTVMVLCTAGCTYRAARLPAPDEFAKPHERLVQEYPDLDPVFPRHSEAERFGMARAEDFLVAWGEPAERELSWWNLWPGNWPFVPQYLWRWRLAGKTVQCRIDHPFYDGFAPTVCNCEYLEAP